jgi:hypothetical protein
VPVVVATLLTTLRCGPLLTTIRTEAGAAIPSLARIADRVVASAAPPDAETAAGLTIA